MKRFLSVVFVVVMLFASCMIPVSYADGLASVDSDGRVVSPDGRWQLPLNSYWEVVNGGEEGSLYAIDAAKVKNKVYLDLYGGHIQLNFPVDVEVGKTYTLEDMSSVNDVNSDAFGPTFDMIVQQISFYDYGQFSVIPPIAKTMYKLGLEPLLPTAAMSLRVDRLDDQGVIGYVLIELSENQRGINKLEYYFASQNTLGKVGGKPSKSRNTPDSNYIQSTCIRCHGTGVQICRSCGGTGYIVESASGFGQTAAKQRRCNACDGRGYATCEACWGN